jgi:hypothetical protein
MVSGGPWVCCTALGGRSCRDLTKTLDKMQQMASDINKMRRASSSYSAMGD